MENPDPAPSAFWKRPRAVALWLAMRGDELLVFEGQDASEPRPFYRPLGGGIEFGELSVDAVVREVREELGIELLRPRLLTTLENVFSFEGEQRHEIVFLYLAEPADRAFYGQDRPPAVEADGSRIVTMWRPLSDFRDGSAVLYPEGLLEVLDAMPGPGPVVRG
jgi:ADP-ribose pyrophosphatase YjhB (NUDIX family)